VLVNFLDNHDLPRFLFENGDVGQLRSALDFLYTWDGIPCLYYGTEQGFDGGVDPRNREDMQFATDGELYAHIKALIQLRKDNPALRRGTVVPAWSTTVTGARRDGGIFAFERVDAEQTALVVLNVSDADSETCAEVADGGACMETSFPPGTTLTDIGPDGAGDTFTVASDGTVVVTVPAHAVRVLVAD
jgi:glycosidase